MGVCVYVNFLTSCKNYWNYCLVMCVADNKLVLLAGQIGCISYIKGVILQLFVHSVLCIFLLVRCSAVAWY